MRKAMPFRACGYAASQLVTVADRRNVADQDCRYGFYNVASMALYEDTLSNLHAYQIIILTQC